MQSHPTLSRAVLAGFAGTAAMTAMIYLVAPMMGLHLDITAMPGSMLGGSWAAGMMMHLVNGALIFPAIYALVGHVLYGSVLGVVASAPEPHVAHA